MSASLVVSLVGLIACLGGALVAVAVVIVAALRERRHLRKWTATGEALPGRARGHRVAGIVGGVSMLVSALGLAAVLVGIGMGIAGG